MKLKRRNQGKRQLLTVPQGHVAAMRKRTLDEHAADLRELKAIAYVVVERLERLEQLEKSK